jgi:hypothetical protein
MNSKKIFLDYDPKYQGIVKLSAYLWFVCFAIFMVQTVLLISNLKLFGYANAGDWDAFLRLLDSNAIPFILIKVNFIALRVIYILTILGYLAAVWKLHKSAALAMLGFTLVSLPVILVSQAFQLVLVPLAHDYTLAAAAGSASALLAMAKMLYTMTDIGDAFVALVLFDGLLISWALIALKKPHPRYFAWWILLLAILPIGRFIGLPILGLANAVLTGLLFVAVGIFMLRFAPKQADPAQSS